MRIVLWESLTGTPKVAKSSGSRRSAIYLMLPGVNGYYAKSPWCPHTFPYYCGDRFRVPEDHHTNTSTSRRILPTRPNLMNIMLYMVRSSLRTSSRRNLCCHGKIRFSHLSGLPNVHIGRILKYLISDRGMLVGPLHG